MLNNTNTLNSFYSLFLAVRPDPPVSLNWTRLNVSPSGVSYDVMVNWEPPPSADAPSGWMRILYEIQYRERNSTKWEAVSLDSLIPSLLWQWHGVRCTDTCKHTSFKTSGKKRAFVHVRKLAQMQTLKHPLKSK